MGASVVDKRDGLLYESKFGLEHSSRIPFPHINLDYFANTSHPSHHLIPSIPGVMFVSTAFAALWLVPRLQAMPLADGRESNTTTEIVKRDPCDGVNASPVLYHEYREEDCPARRKLNSEGHCPTAGFDAQERDCHSYCQVREYFPRKWTIYLHPRRC